MKTRYFIAILSAALLWGACNKDNDSFLQLDGDNATGPLLDAGQHETAVRFTADRTRQFNGRQLTEVHWYTGPRPAATQVKVYGPGPGNAPGSLLYSKDVSSSVRPFNWNVHRLDTPIEITGQELWIAIAFTHAERGQTIGCDAGPNRIGGDWLFTLDNQWRTYIQRTGESINWNIRGKVSN